MAESVVNTFTVGDNDLTITVIAEGTWPTTDPNLGWIAGYNWTVKNQAQKARLFVTWIGHPTIPMSAVPGLSGQVRFPGASGKRMHTGFYIEHRAF